MIDTAAGARDLMATMLAQPWGHSSASVYETGRLVTLAPWLDAHDARVDFLIDGQHADGGWGGPDGYAMVPTLSATEALLTELWREADRTPGTGGAVARRALAAHRGLTALFAALERRPSLPDTPAVEIITPALIADVNAHLRRLADRTVAGLDSWRGARLPLPAGADDVLLHAVRDRLASGAPIADKLLHSWEILGGVHPGGLRPAPVGSGTHATVGASPAATAAWLATHRPVPRHHPARRYLDAVVARFGGPVPSVYPITAFERGWVLSALGRSGIDLAPPRQILTDLSATLGPTGTPGGAGLPPDADSTAMALLTLSELDKPRELEMLRTFEADTHFRTWHGERTPSPTVNAHVLEAFGQYRRRQTEVSVWHLAVIDKTAAWLRDRQAPDGSWLDKWHASPYYATVRCVLALDRHGGLPSVAAVRRAVDWILDTQRTDGSWGRWNGTFEETAYALQILLLIGPSATPAIGPAAVRGYRYLCQAWQPGRRWDEQSHPPLWHDKDLYLPALIVRATALGAVHAAQQHPRVAPIVSSVSFGR